MRASNGIIIKERYANEISCWYNDFKVSYNVTFLRIKISISIVIDDIIFVLGN